MTDEVNTNAEAVVDEKPKKRRGRPPKAKPSQDTQQVQEDEKPAEKANEAAPALAKDDPEVMKWCDEHLERMIRDGHSDRNIVLTVCHKFGLVVDMPVKASFRDHILSLKKK